MQQAVQCVYSYSLVIFVLAPAQMGLADLLGIDSAQRPVANEAAPRSGRDPGYGMVHGTANPYLVFSCSSSYFREPSRSG